MKRSGGCIQGELEEGELGDRENVSRADNTG